MKEAQHGYLQETLVSITKYRTIPNAAGLAATLQPIPVHSTPDGARALERWPHGIFHIATHRAIPLEVTGPAYHRGRKGGRVVEGGQRLGESGVRFWRRMAGERGKADLA